MNAALPAELRDQFPPELLTAIAENAEQDAILVAEFLATFCEEVERQNPGCGLLQHYHTLFPANFLLELGAALRLLEWESADLVRSDMNLPSADERIHHTLLHVGDNIDSPALSRRILRTFAERFAWSAAKELNATILLELLDEDEIAERLAEFLWKHRHAN